MNSLLDDASTYQMNISRRDLNAVIMNYLVTEGYQEASRLFQGEANIQPETVLEPTDARVEVHDAVQNGRITEAMMLLGTHFPAAFTTDKELCFRMQLQHLVELIRAQRFDDALEFAQSHLAEHGQQNPELLGDLERAMALLAFHNPLDSPFADVLYDSQRHKLASQVNAAILKSANKPTISKLEVFYKLIQWIQHELDCNKVKYDCIKEISLAKNESASKQ